MAWAMGRVAYLILPSETPLASKAGKLPLAGQLEASNPKVAPVVH